MRVHIILLYNYSFFLLSLSLSLSLDLFFYYQNWLNMLYYQIIYLNIKESTNAIIYKYMNFATFHRFNLIQDEKVHH